ncbi:hypothetical protein N7523_005747 [Penicillium sp. IBT 18751x]|nr:hypothetical protein N7523_005661 [Penicillium sp. IBT 18751x]KAJ6117996.1 hypothetical protein N7523_005747 [Penicillium sp. IBT 18751x]
MSHLGRPANAFSFCLLYVGLTVVLRDQAPASARTAPSPPQETLSLSGLPPTPSEDQTETKKRIWEVYTLLMFDPAPILGRLKPQSGSHFVL